MTADYVMRQIQQKYPDIAFKVSDTYYWSPSDQTVFYKKNDATEHGLWALLHEIGHGLLGHTKYYSDFELVRMEMEAWEKAKEIAATLQEQRAKSKEQGKDGRGSKTRKAKSSLLSAHCSLLIIPEEHIQDCLDSYRDWLHKRSLCPDCNLSSIQTDAHTYTCVFCHKKWHVTAERFCRPYRRTASLKTLKPKNQKNP